VFMAAKNEPVEMKQVKMKYINVFMVFQYLNLLKYLVI
jgi:hypothetical protein